MRRLSWALAALDDLDRIGTYIAIYDPAAARRVVMTIRTSLDRVREHPESAPLIVELGLRKLTIRRYPYVVLYLPTDESIGIVRVHHAAEDWRPS